ncbi:MAG: DUF333 domain-containing protein [Myxococcales bacterium]|nr:DUF333 domain-containing protein [Myxococcales bacterium]MCB9575467.1 DUF333 domain-containing protein [Polyangiaceae bacterium]
MTLRRYCVVWFVVACTPAPSGPAATSSPNAEPPPRAEPAPTAQGMANPASKHCIDNGGKLEIQTEPAGEYGVCVFADGSRCEEWTFLRGSCKPGSCRQPSGRCP